MSSNSFSSFQPTPSPLQYSNYSSLTTPHTLLLFPLSFFTSSFPPSHSLFSTFTYAAPGAVIRPKWSRPSHKPVPYSVLQHFKPHLLHRLGPSNPNQGKLPPCVFFCPNHPTIHLINQLIIRIRCSKFDFRAQLPGEDQVSSPVTGLTNCYSGTGLWQDRLYGEG